MRPVSEKKARERRAWSAIKATKMSAQLDEVGYHFCERCGVPTDWLELHHIEFASRGGESTEDNAVLVCAGPASCHEKLHGSPWREAESLVLGETEEEHGEASEQGGSLWERIVGTSPLGAGSTSQR